MFIRQFMYVLVSCFLREKVIPELVIFEWTSVEFEFIAELHENFLVVESRSKHIDLRAKIWITKRMKTV